MPLYQDLNSYDPTVKALLTDVEVIHQSIHTIISTRPWENLFDPFGIDLEDSLFELIDELSALDVFRIVTEGVAKFEPRAVINYEKTKVIPVPTEGRFELTLVYSVLGMEDQQFEFVGDLTANGNN